MKPAGGGAEVSVRATISGGVVVGHDGSRGAQAGLVWAAGLAERASWPLHVVQSGDRGAQPSRALKLVLQASPSTSDDQRMSARSVLWCLRCAVSVGLAVLGLIAGVAAFRVPLEAGGILFAPLLLGVAAMCFMAAIAVVAPWGRRSGRAFWEALAQLIVPF